MDRNRIFLIGPPGSGKTAVGQALAAALDCDFFDTDRLIEAQVNLTVQQIFAEHGEDGFRKMERDLLESLESLDVKTTATDTVVFATGGGLPIYNNNLQRLHALGKVIALNADIPFLVSRLKGDSARPLLQSEEQEDEEQRLLKRLTELMKTRWPVYAQAGYKINTSGLTPSEVATEIVRVLHGNN